MRQISIVAALFDWILIQIVLLARVHQSAHPSLGDAVRSRGCCSLDDLVFVHDFVAIGISIIVAIIFVSVSCCITPCRHGTWLCLRAAAPAAAVTDVTRDGSGA
jgi:hypothetical protein